MLRRYVTSLGLLLIVAVLATGCGSAASIAPTSDSATLVPTIMPSEPVSNGPTVAPTPTPEPTVPPTPEPTAAPTPAPKPIVLAGSSSKNTKPFTMQTPARIDLSFSGSGNFIVDINPVGGDVFSGVSVSNTIGVTKFTTFVYDANLDGARAFADVIGSGKWTITITPGAPDAIPAPVLFKSKYGLNTIPFTLSGDYTVTYSHSGSGNFIVDLVPVEGAVFGGENIANDIGHISSTTELYGESGDYYLDIVADGAWSIAIKGQT